MSSHPMISIPTQCGARRHAPTSSSYGASVGTGVPTRPSDQYLDQESPDGDVDYWMLMWKAERGANSPLGTPPRPTVTPPFATPCGCASSSIVESGSGEFVCESCGVVTGRVVNGRDTAVRLSPTCGDAARLRSTPPQQPARCEPRTRSRSAFDGDRGAADGAFEMDLC
eukprot:SAG11_NODE_349_length_10401_cov_22.873423_6_plen_169_part_00